jgi:hypothetical protein
MFKLCCGSQPLLARLSLVGFIPTIVLGPDGLKQPDQSWVTSIRQQPVELFFRNILMQVLCICLLLETTVVHLP